MTAIEHAIMPPVHQTAIAAHHAGPTIRPMSERHACSSPGVRWGEIKRPQGHVRKHVVSPQGLQGNRSPLMRPIVSDVPTSVYRYYDDAFRVRRIRLAKSSR